MQEVYAISAAYHAEASAMIWQTLVWITVIPSIVGLVTCIAIAIAARKLS